jgi:DNA polymerase-3 subunit delta'
MPPLPGTERHPHARVVLGGALPPAGAPSHAYLFQGPAGAGKRSAARAFAAALLADGAPDPAGVRARVERGAHPDLTWVTPSGAHELLTEDVDGPVIAAVSRTPFEARRRVWVIERADTMNEPTANRMLKTLEEPPAFAHLLLLTDRPGEVLPTIASRCQHVRFDPPPEGELAAALRAEGVAEAAALACARLAQGDGQRARALALGEGPELRAEAEAYARAALHGTVEARPWVALLARARAAGARAREEVEAAAERERPFLARSELRRAATAAEERARRARRRAERGTLDLALSLAGLWLRDVAALAWAAPDAVLAGDRLDALREDAAGRDPAALRAGVELVEETRERFALNVSEELALEALAGRLERRLAHAQGA